MRFLAVEGLPGQEKAIGAAVIDELKKAGVPASAIRFDKVNERIPVPTQTGNLFVDLPGTRPGPRLLFITHLDTVPMCAGAKAKREGNRIVSDGTTALSGDNRTGCAVLVTLVETLLKFLCRVTHENFYAGLPAPRPRGGIRPRPDGGG